MPKSPEDPRELTKKCYEDNYCNAGSYFVPMYIVVGSYYFGVLLSLKVASLKERRPGTKQTTSNRVYSTLHPFSALMVYMSVRKYFIYVIFKCSHPVTEQQVIYYLLTIFCRGVFKVSAII
jgi:hypothetical protein